MLRDVTPEEDAVLRLMAGHHIGNCVPKAPMHMGDWSEEMEAAYLAACPESWTRLRYAVNLVFAYNRRP